MINQKYRKFIYLSQLSDTLNKPPVSSVNLLFRPANCELKINTGLRIDLGVGLEMRCCQHFHFIPNNVDLFLIKANGVRYLY